MSEKNPLFDRLFDYAGVFPPANHSPEEAVRRYRSAKSEPDGWLLGPFLIRASQRQHLDLDGIDFGLVLDLDLGSVPGEGRCPVQLETILADPKPAVFGPLLNLAPVVYVESPATANHAFLTAVAAARQDGNDVRAKIRAGGASADRFPTPSLTAEFIATCVAMNIPFKATAGLHQPFRHPSVIAEATEHGFINLLAATRAALAGSQDLVPILSETDPSAFDASLATWKGVGGSVPATEIRTAFRGIGSCSFDEPAGYLRSLGLLESPL